jgi:hypothetical protein
LTERFDIVRGDPPRVHVMGEMCSTCVFRPGNLMDLHPGRLRQMIHEAQRDESTIVCHSTLGGQAPHNAACRGFFDRFPTRPLQVADRLGLVEYD